MKHSTRNRFWPYDEVVVSRTAESSTGLTFQAPWMTLMFNVNPDYFSHCEAAIKAIQKEQLTHEDFDSIDWLFAGVAKYPLAYLLPRSEKFGIDRHEIDSQFSNLPTGSPSALLEELIVSDAYRVHFFNFNKNYRFESWSWDVQAALGFSRCYGGFDPKSIFSVARRFHLLNDIEVNQTADLLAKVDTLKNSHTEFNMATVKIIRQNHYITMECDRVLRAALPKAQSATTEVLEFIEAEAGHDRLLEKALTSMGVNPENVPIQSSAYILMELFFKISQINFLAFAIVVDIFERTSYEEVDPLASVLTKAGANVAAAQIDRHRVINDTGEHENVALQFLNDMGPVTSEYAIQALQLGELLTLVIHCLSKETLSEIIQQEKIG